MSLSLQYKQTLKDCSFFSTPQQTSGVDLALLLVDTLQKSGFSVSQEYIGKESSSIVGLMYITGAEPFMGGCQHTKFPKNCMKLRKLWSVGGPPLDPPLHHVYQCCTNSCIIDDTVVNTPVVYSNIRLQPHIDQERQHWSCAWAWNRTTRNNRCHPCPAKGEV